MVGWALDVVKVRVRGQVKTKARSSLFLSARKSCESVCKGRRFLLEQTLRRNGQTHVEVWLASAMVAGKRMQLRWASTHCEYADLRSKSPVYACSTCHADRNLYHSYESI
jgi:hypothetical protein